MGLSRTFVRFSRCALFAMACVVVGCARGFVDDDVPTIRRDVERPDLSALDDVTAGDRAPIDATPGDVEEEFKPMIDDFVPDDAVDSFVPPVDVPMGSDAGCVGDPRRICTPGQTQACGSCGSQTCTISCAWGTCMGTGSCMPGQTQACGRCGTQSCTTGCGWSTCGGEGVCMPGQTQRCGRCGTQTCTAGCAWGTCTAEGPCAAGATRAGTCDSCAQEVCSASCTWGACTLRPGNACEYRAGVNARACSACMCGRQWCLSSCQWSTACTSCCSSCGGCL